MKGWPARLCQEELRFLLTYVIEGPELSMKRLSFDIT